MSAILKRTIDEALAQLNEQGYSLQLGQRNGYYAIDKTYPNTSVDVLAAGMSLTEVALWLRGFINGISETRKMK